MKKLSYEVVMVDFFTRFFNLLEQMRIFLYFNVFHLLYTSQIIYVHKYSQLNSKINTIMVLVAPLMISNTLDFLFQFFSTIPILQGLFFSAIPLVGEEH